MRSVGEGLAEMPPVSEDEELRAKVARLEAGNEAFAKILAEQNAHIERLKDLNKMAIEKLRLKAGKIEVMSGHLDEKDDQIAVMQEQLDEKDDQIESLQQKLVSKQRRVESLKASHSEKDEIIGRISGENERLAENNKNLKKEIASLRVIRNKEKANYLVEQQKASEKQKALQERIDEFSKRLAEMKLALEDAKKEAEPSRIAAEAAKAEAESEKAQRAEVEISLKKANRQIEKRDSHIGALEIEIEEKNSRIGTLESEIEENQSCIGILETEIEVKDSRIEALERKIEDKYSRIETLESDIEEKDSQIKILKEEAEEKDLRIESLEIKFAQAQTKSNFESLYSENGNLKSQVKQLSRFLLDAHDSAVPIYNQHIFSRKTNQERLVIESLYNFYQSIMTMITAADGFLELKNEDIISIFVCFSGCGSYLKRGQWQPEYLEKLLEVAENIEESTNTELTIKLKKYLLYLFVVQAQYLNTPQDEKIKEKIIRIGVDIYENLCVDSVSTSEHHRFAFMLYLIIFETAITEDDDMNIAQSCLSKLNTILRFLPSVPNVIADSPQKKYAEACSIFSKRVGLPLEPPSNIVNGAKY